MANGPYGSDLYGDGGEGFPSAPRTFSARPGMQGPQVILSWEAAPLPPQGIVIRRKQGEYPRDLEDGSLVLNVEDGAGDLLQCVDLADELLPADALPGEGVWWYYRAFVLPAPIPLDEQFAGLGRQALIPSIGENTAASTAIDVQGLTPVTIYLQNTAVVAASVVHVETSPNEDGPWASLDEVNVAAGTSETWSSDAPMKFLRVVNHGLPAAIVMVQFSAHREVEWITGDVLTAPCYVFKTGRHLAAALTCLPEFYFTDDEAQELHQLTQGPGADGEYFNLGRDGGTLGPLTRLMMVYLAEFDRVDAYLRSVRRYLPDIDGMPPHLFAHVAARLGDDLEVDGRNLEEVRDEIRRIAGVWKLKGTTRLVQATGAQIFGVVPRVQEGAGRVFRVADPDLYGRVAGESLMISD